MADKKWIIQANKELYQMQDVSIEEEEHWSRGGLLRALPFYSNPMEEHKHSVLLHFLKRCEKPVELFINVLAEVVQELKYSYNQLDPEWRDDTERLLQLTILDGCFMLEVVRVATHLMDDYAPNDHIFSNQGKLHIMPYLKYEGFVIKLLIEFYSPSAAASRMGQCKHSLDVYRKSQLQREPYCKTEKQNHQPQRHLIRQGVLRLPAIVVDDTTESMFLNLIALESFHVGAGNEVTSYIFFMDNIIDNARDAALLHAKGILQNALGSDKAVANLFNYVSRFTTARSLGTCGAPFSFHTYFRNPWAFISLIAGVFLFVLAIAQTGYSINPCYFPNDDPPTCVCYLNNSTTPATPPNAAYSTSPSRFIIYFVLMSVVSVAKPEILGGGEKFKKFGVPKKT
ncbi:hypothetical protein D8674_009418 [Pyrus ussuriensis x Pyrus communis]|uniref:Uncharacterized protein n=1 Tax=Pyrus ussuriensis x Pyrus communis TaxID=2448454 RepID=A0A5N5F869_9ROSA|nr:hypothetical protein D8674_009418 [Pyrus ussuriensis x Pyrus communis]